MSNAQKIPLVRSLSTFAQQKALDEIQKRGLALPGYVRAVNGSIVTVNFAVKDLTLPLVTMPVFGPEYVRYPVQVGDLGVAFPADVYLGGVSGLGGGVADSSLLGNLSTLVWFPIGNKNWSAVDPNATTIYGPNGVVLRDSNGQTTFTLTPSGLEIAAQTSITLTVGGKSLVITASGITIEGREFLAHNHTPGTMEAGGQPVVNDSGGSCEVLRAHNQPAPNRPG